MIETDDNMKPAEMSEILQRKNLIVETCFKECLLEILHNNNNLNLPKDGRKLHQKMSSFKSKYQSELSEISTKDWEMICPSSKTSNSEDWTVNVLFAVVLNYLSHSNHIQKHLNDLRSIFNTLNHGEVKDYLRSAAKSNDLVSGMENILTALNYSNMKKFEELKNDPIDSFFMQFVQIFKVRFSHVQDDINDLKQTICKIDNVCNEQDVVEMFKEHETTCALNSKKLKNLMKKVKTLIESADLVAAERRSDDENRKHLLEIVEKSKGFESELKELIKEYENLSKRVDQHEKRLKDCEETEKRLSHNMEDLQKRMSDLEMKKDGITVVSTNATTDTTNVINDVLVATTNDGRNTTSSVPTNVDEAGKCYQPDDDNFSEISYGLQGRTFTQKTSDVGVSSGLEKEPADEPPSNCCSTHHLQNEKQNMIADLLSSQKEKLIRPLDMKVHAYPNWYRVGLKMFEGNEQILRRLESLHSCYCGGGNRGLHFLRTLKAYKSTETCSKFAIVAKKLNRDDIYQLLKDDHTVLATLEDNDDKKLELATMLNEDYRGWIYFAEKYNFTSRDIRMIKQSVKEDGEYSPTNRLLDWLEIADKSLSQLKDACEQLGFQNVIKVINEIELELLTQE